jgi:peptidoglycan/LPS O-acetylase OafA/YrhL
VDRHYGMDWLRIAAFALLIFYHVGMFFGPWGWHVKTAQPLDWVALPMLATNAWRLGLLFVVSGYASAALFAKRGEVGGFLTNRSARLLVPLIAGMAVFVVPQPWVELVFKHGYAADLGWFWVHDYFDFAPIEGIMLPTWQHLWFVAYLWLYTLVLGLILLLPARWRERGADAVDRMLGGGLVLAVPLALLLARLWLGWPGAEETHDVVNDGYAHTFYLPLFLFGYALRGAERTWAAIRRWWKLAALLALASYAVVAWIGLTWPGDTPVPGPIYPLFGAARAVMAWSAIVALIGVADRFWNRDHVWRPTLTEAVFPFYIVHQTIIVWLGWYLLRFAVPPLAEFVILTAATVGGCWAFYLLGREIAPLRPLIGLRTKAS